MEARVASDGGGEVETRGERMELIPAASPLRARWRTVLRVDSGMAEVEVAVERWRRRRWRVAAQRAMAESPKRESEFMRVF